MSALFVTFIDKTLPYLNLISLYTKNIFALVAGTVQYSTPPECKDPESIDVL
jgi:hypothetical protein